MASHRIDRNRLALVLLAALGLASARGCYAEFPPDGDSVGSGSGGGHGRNNEGGSGNAGGTHGLGDGGEQDVGGQGGDSDSPLAFDCIPPKTGEALPARSAVMSTTVSTSIRTIFVGDIFDRFKANCGGCHVEANLGEFQAKTAQTFTARVDQSVLELIRSDNPDEVMPPLNAGGRLWSERPEGDSVRELARLLELWIAAGKPASFTETVESTGASPYLLAPEDGMGMTNLGNCVPNQLAYSTQADDRDAGFAALEKKPAGEGTLVERIGLPQKLVDTDLDTLDSAKLSQQGVIAYAPAYPLWSDSAGKLRHVRVPRGKSIQYDRATHEFVIPGNTRFYKTFMKKIVDVDGEERFRKIETRVIVVRPDQQLPDGSVEPTALYGTYLWNEEETEAELLVEPLRNGEPFRDRLLTFVTDHPLEAEIVATNPPNLALALEAKDVLRHYAVPGSERCVQCHMGSVSKSFVLGFTPLQLNWRPHGEGGVVEATGEDELNQLQRLIDLGVVTGLDSADEVPPLEESQGARMPRTPEELTAQGYMLGNCAHCHNPRGFPSVTIPELKELLDFWPSRSGGIFEFPLDRTSPRIVRGIEAEIPIPYITPSLRDIWPSYLIIGGAAVFSDQRWQTKAAATLVEERPGLGGILTPVYFSAPWRSLIYRNVDTPFTYAEDFAIYPHMPANTPGFDCRARRILGDWMVSIPARIANPDLDESAIPGVTTGKPLDTSSQPYVEVRPGDADYDEAMKRARARLEEWHAGDRYNLEYCPNTDIVDPEILRGKYLTPRDIDGSQGTPPVVGVDNVPIWVTGDRIPDRPHWVVTDLTEVPGPWNPRRLDWYDVLVDGNVPEPDSTDPTYLEVLLPEYEAEVKVVDLLANVHITDAFREFALTERAFGLWKEKSECNFDGVPKAGEYAGDARPEWMAKAAAEAPVYTTLPGAAVYGMICINCHGTKADSRGRQADLVAQLTGGDARVANFVRGLFGPPDDPGANMERVYGEGPAEGGGFEDWASRYLAWMALGGTERRIPKEVLDQVARTKVLGEQRTAFAPSISANMLTVAEALCARVAAKGNTLKIVPQTGRVKWSDGTPLIVKNGDADLWVELCARDNIAVRVVGVPKDATGVPAVNGSVMYAPQAYPASAPVVDHRGRVVAGVHDDNFFPWCIERSPDEAELEAAIAYAEAHPLRDAGDNEGPMPLCPEELGSATPLTQEQRDALATRGAINAGLAVFLFLREFSGGAWKKPSFDRCEELGN